MKTSITILLFLLNIGNLYCQIKILKDTTINESNILLGIKKHEKNTYIYICIKPNNEEIEKIFEKNKESFMYKCKECVTLKLEENKEEISVDNIYEQIYERINLIYVFRKPIDEKKIKSIAFKETILNKINLIYNYDERNTKTK
jgi:hypothetical protein